MSVEDRHSYASDDRYVSGHRLARVRQALYDLKLALEAKDIKRAKELLIVALDETQRWT